MSNIKKYGFMNRCCKSNDLRSIVKKCVRISVILLCFLLAGCSSQKNNGSEKAGISPEERKAQEQADKRVEEFNETMEKQESEMTPTPEVHTEEHRFKKEKDVYSDNVRSVKVLGLKEYGGLKSENYDAKKQKGYADRPPAGKKYLVLFLEIRNNAEEDVYFHPDYLSAKVDGKEVGHTVLVNEPEGYGTIFRTVKARDYNEGFIAWEVPEGWKKLVMTFRGFEPLGGKRLKLTMLSGDLCKPPVPEKPEE